ncbi:MAG: aminotransferase class IV [Candidatus Peregrinibacteria bacterium]|nr:aminotransferase class IV [Candidatus Peregrinibacteria bacterium]
MAEVSQKNGLMIENAEINAPTQPNTRLFAKNGISQSERGWISKETIAPEFRDRLVHPNRRENDDAVYCYKSINGEWIPELRTENTNAAMHQRIEDDLNNSANQVAGVLARGTDGNELMRRFRPKPARGRSAFSTIVTMHSDMNDHFGRAHLGTTDSLPIPNSTNYTRISVFNALNDRTTTSEIVLETLKPGTREDDEKFSIDSVILNQQEIDFEGISSDNQTLAFYDPIRKKWTVQTIPFGIVGMHPYDARNHYINGFFTGIIAYEINGNVYAFRLDEHIKRAVRDAKKTQFPYVSEDMLYAMAKTQLTADKRWVPNACLNIDDPDTGKKGIGNRHYFRIFAAPTHLGPKIAKPGKSRNKMMGAIGTAAGPYKDKDMLNIVLRGSRPVNPVFAANKYSGSYQGPMDDLQPYLMNGYDEGLFSVDTNQTVEGRRLQEGSGCNYIIVKCGKDGQQPTMLIPDPKNHSDLLPGITCKSVAELAESYGYNVQWKDVQVEDMENADEILATGTAMSVRGVNKVDWDTGEKDENGNSKMIMQTIFDRGNQKTMGTVGQRLSDDMKRIMRGQHPDPKFNAWMQKIEN